MMTKELIDLLADLEGTRGVMLEKRLRKWNEGLKQAQKVNEEVKEEVAEEVAEEVVSATRDRIQKKCPRARCPQRLLILLLQRVNRAHEILNQVREIQDKQLQEMGGRSFHPQKRPC
jgi:hypothetical protein